MGSLKARYVSQYLVHGRSEEPANSGAYKERSDYYSPEESLCVLSVVKHPRVQVVNFVHRFNFR
jgi:hypothetical protein